MSFTDIIDQKKEVRKILMAKRMAITAEEINLASDKICKQLLELEEFQQAQIVHIYLPIEKKKEVDTLPIIDASFRLQKQVIVPITEFDHIELQHVILNDLSELKKNKWGVPEPVNREEVEVERLELVVVPMVGGDYSGNRIGYGKGYYDSFLQKVKCPKIGLLYDACLVEQLPVEDHDVKLDYLITEKRIIH